MNRIDLAVFARIQSDKDQFDAFNTGYSFNPLLVCPAAYRNPINEQIKELELKYITVASGVPGLRGRVAIKVYLFRMPEFTEEALARTLTYPESIYDCGISRVEHLA